MVRVVIIIPDGWQLRPAEKDWRWPAKREQSEIGKRKCYLWRESSAVTSPGGSLMTNLMEPNFPSIIHLVESVCLCSPSPAFCIPLSPARAVIIYAWRTLMFLPSLCIVTLMKRGSLERQLLLLFPHLSSQVMQALCLNNLAGLDQSTASFLSPDGCGVLSWVWKKKRREVFSFFFFKSFGSKWPRGRAMVSMAGRCTPRFEH